MAEDISDQPAVQERANGDGSWAVKSEDLGSQTTFTFVRRSDLGQPSTPPTPVDHPEDSTDTVSEADDRNDTPTNHPPRLHPRFSRAFSLPQLGRLQNPHRAGQRPTLIARPTDPGTQFFELSLELADMVQMAIQTLLQISPPQVLEPTREQFSACALSVPTPSMSAMFTAMRNLNYFSANMATFCQEPPDEMLGSGPTGLIAHTSFDLGELMQSVGDVMSGAAAEAGVDLVLYHGDLSLKYAWVSGSESGLTVALSHVLRQIMSVARPGDSIEVGLFIGFAPAPGQEITISDELITADAITSSPTSEDGPIHCTIQIAHKFAQSNPYTPQSEPESRAEPHFSGLILRRLLRQIGGSLTHDLPSSTAGRTCELSLTFDRAPAGTVDTSPAGTPGTTEPTLEELRAFADTLKGAKVALYASSKGSFAQHVTRYLADWGMDVSHMSADGDADEVSSPPSPTTPSVLDPGAAKAEASKVPVDPQRPSFVFIDDNVEILKERLNALRVEQPYPLTLNPKARSERPPLVHHQDARPTVPHPLHSRRSTTQVPRVMSASPMPPPFSPLSTTTSVVIVHFTSLANFKVVKDVLQSVLSSYSSPIPEVMIVPKPAGPQRVLTQLHMAVTRPPVDPFFSPIATSPATPASSSSFMGHSYLHSQTSNRSPRPPSARSNSDRSSRSGTKELLERATAGLPPPSPLGMSHTNSNGSEYFSSEDAVHLGAGAVQLGSTPSSGLLISSPPGQPAGIFFSPRAKTNAAAPAARKASFGPPMERDRGQLGMPTSSSRRSSGSGQRITSATLTDNPTFSSLHEVGAGVDRSPRPPSRLAIPVPISPQTEPVRESVLIPPPVARTESGEAAAAQTGSGSAASSPQMSSPTPTFRRPMRRRTATPDIKVLETAKKAPDIDIVPPISVLIVEDNVVNQMQLAGFMRKKKLKFQLANNGLEAVEKWKTGNFDLILMDIQMPVMDGIDATKEIRRLEKLNAAEGYPPVSPSSVSSPTSATSTLNATTPSIAGASPYRSSVIIVAQTASSLNSDRVKALAAGCNDFLTKPVNHHWLNNKVTEWGSIKALQMWADMPPLGGGPQSPFSVAQAKEVADRLHVPERGLLRRAAAKLETKVQAECGVEKDKEEVALEAAVPVSSVQDTHFLDTPSPIEGEPAFFCGGRGAHFPIADAVKVDETATDAAEGVPPDTPSPPSDFPPVRTALPVDDVDGESDFFVSTRGWRGSGPVAEAAIKAGGAGASASGGARPRVRVDYPAGVEDREWRGYGRTDRIELSGVLTADVQSDPDDPSTHAKADGDARQDNVVNQMQLAGFMRKKKLKFQVADNGLDAVEKWKTGNFDLILMDIQMPVMDGIDATKEIRRLEKLNAAEGYPPVSLASPTSATSGLSSTSPYRSVTIIALTASSLNSDRVKALAAGCNDFLTKPVNHRWLNNKVMEWGSIKALQMWADVPPPGGDSQSPLSVAKAKEVADRLHVPERGLNKRAAAKPETKTQAECGVENDQEEIALGAVPVSSDTIKVEVATDVSEGVPLDASPPSDIPSVR
ncbi:hypothetical protein MSAN_01404500 [Mycena sanguinolenta]|uniref:Response regulatory domain-containing protein n=1 Tax=Mycena sanguinolenta TaxID=230812 RepID=A0A8H6Y617_9AGAR|nr:hypothetical protein MSAN_01404500 [Mycena sanguinolenta]